MRGIFWGDLELPRRDKLSSRLRGETVWRKKSQLSDGGPQKGKGPEENGWS